MWQFFTLHCFWYNTDHIIGYSPCYLRFTNHPTQHYLSINKVVSDSKQVEKKKKKILRVEGYKGSKKVTTYGEGLLGKENF